MTARLLVRATAPGVAPIVRSFCDGSGGSPASNWDGGGEIGRGSARGGSVRGGKRMVWRMRDEACSFYWLGRGPRLTDMATVSTVLQRCRGVGEELGRCSVAWRTLWTSWRNRMWTGWLGRCRCLSQGRNRGQGEDGVDGASACSGVPVGVAMPILASLDDMGTSWPGLCWSLLGQGLVPACLVEEGQPPGHDEMSHPWMYGNRCAPAFREGVNSFLLVAEANKSKQGFMCCPCLKCKNEKDYSYSRDIKSHLLRFGFMSSYNVWTKHGEEGVMMEDGDEEEDNDDQYRSMFSECDDTAMEDNEEEGGEEHAADDPVDDDLRRAISDARRYCGTDKERLQFDKMLEDHHKLLYPGCEDGQRKLGSILELLKWKAEVGVTDSGFEKLMIILKKLFPRNNELPVSTYEAKKLVCPLGLDVQKIHACINDCILYPGEMACNSHVRWEPQEEGMMRTVASFPSERNQGLIEPGGAKKHVEG
ncbi:hypothetical protein QYE76_033408 [Lolium multiflorum]|uniref:Transposase-associated domain-containing protein n=1 Tax=Lolium multiflorum TaxID=4521 RepID=A0AAD8QV79_LOLMU|nr:hypothetical protein QYE76_033408 [Lolium multiflorum]